MSFTPIILGSGLTGYAFLTKTRTEQADTLQQTSQNQREAQQLRETLPQIQTSDDLMDNRQMLRIVLGAFGLDEDIDNRAFVKQVLDSDLDDPASLANRLSDKRYFALANTFGFNSSDGPQVLNAAAREADNVTLGLSLINSAEDLLNDNALMRATLNAFDLPSSDVSNRFFLEEVLASDPSDPDSFVNSLSDTRYLDMVTALDFQTKNGNSDTLLGFAQLVQSKETEFDTAQDLLDERDVLDAALTIFGLDDLSVTDEFLTDVLNSDLDDPASFANQQDDPMWATFSNALGIGEKLARPDSFRAENTPLDRLVEAVEDRTAPFTSAEEFSVEFTISLAAAQFFDLPTDEAGFNRARLVLESDPGNPGSLRNVLSDPRYELYASAVAIQPDVDTKWVPPAGFSDAIFESYLERQFEIRVGEVDPNMRLALGFERELNGLLENASTNDARWFGVMASEPLRQVFEKALNLPDSFGSLDLDRQLSDFQTRSEAFLGTADIEELTSPENVDQLIRRFLSNVTIAGNTTFGATSGASTILSTIQASLGAS